MKNELLFRIVAVTIAILFGAFLFYLFISAFDLYVSQKCLEMPAGEMINSQQCKELFQ